MSKHRSPRPRLATLLLACLALPGFAQDTGLRNWTAPPYWISPRAATDGTGSAELAGRSSRQALVLPSSPLPFVAIAPCRQYDSRDVSLPLLQNIPQTITLVGTPCGIPPTAQAVAVNITIFDITGAIDNGVLWVGVADPPTTSWINYPPTETQRANAGAVAVTDPGGAIVVRVNQGAGAVGFLVDVFGYYAPQGIVSSFNTLIGDVTLSAGTNVTITPSGNTLTIATTGSGGATGPTGSTGATGPIGPIGPTGAPGAGAPPGSMVFGASGDTTLIGAGYTEISPSRLDYWAPTATAGAPSARLDHTAVWTGSRMIVWGGAGNDGGRYDPVTSTWTATTMAGAPQARGRHTAVWTGSLMIVWGGEWTNQGSLNDGGRYDPVADTWKATDTAFAPTARIYHTAVWTGSRMIVWGGTSGTILNDGGLYDPAANTWAAMTTAGAPSAREYHTAVWTGSRMIVWGGVTSSFVRANDGALYDPLTNTWTATTPPAQAPSARALHTAVWTGSKMIVWGGDGGSGSFLSDGGRYDPVANTWTAVMPAGAPSGRIYHTAVWTGSRMIVWGGTPDVFTRLNDGGQYDPAANAWTATTTTGGPIGRTFHTAVWTGSGMIVWGGWTNAGPTTNDGGQWRTVSLYVKN